jgi:DNA (cytosine-5)-methyltransferase 1
MKLIRKIPVIDLFAGPGGLAEGFSTLTHERERIFDICLSIEKEKYAHKTLELRSFCRQFPPNNLPIEYYKALAEPNDYKRQKRIQLLYHKYNNEYKKAQNEAWNAELGGKYFPNELVDNRIKAALNGNKNWLLIGGPPCQAYSIVGRSRRQEVVLDEKKDSRVGLYKHYLRILAVHNPAAFIMENVKGLLSAKTRNNNVFTQILKDLSDPLMAVNFSLKQPDIKIECPGYRIYSLVRKPKSFKLDNSPDFDQKDFVIQSEKYGIPQTRHRVILLGIRKDIDYIPEIINETDQVPISKVLSGLPEIRSRISKRVDDFSVWKKSIGHLNNANFFVGINSDLRAEILENLKTLNSKNISLGSEYIPNFITDIEYKPDWFLDRNLHGICNHNARSHMISDLQRYFFIACLAKIGRKSPTLSDLPDALLPEHHNIKHNKGDIKFADRFRVQLWEEPAKTITSHISKDGHYYIHPDPIQCRSLTVREAARIQTFPDNYFFVGSRTSQFAQVGNAVPPLLANQIANVVSKIFKTITYEGNY